MFLFFTPAGILKNVKDHIRECSHCQIRRGLDDGSGARLFSRPGRRKANTNDEDEEDEEEEEGDDGLFFTDSSGQLRSKSAKSSKHELVFVCSSDLSVSLPVMTDVLVLIIRIILLIFRQFWSHWCREAQPAAV